LEIIVIAVALAGAAAFASWYYSAHRRMVRRLAELGAVPIADVPEGASVRIVGTLSYVGEPLLSPITRRSCACYHVLVKEKHGKRMETVIDESRYSDFLVRDGSGVALVRVVSASLAIVRDEHRYTGGFGELDPTDEMKELLARHEQSSTARGIFFDSERRLTYEEGLLEAGETVAVFGRGRWEPDPDPTAGRSYRDRAMRLVLDDPDPPATMIISDDPGATR
jgi:hypothetical protein